MPSRQRACMYCGAAIINCNGAVIPRDFVRAMDGLISLAEVRELCPHPACHEKWQAFLAREAEEASP